MNSPGRLQSTQGPVWSAMVSLKRRNMLIVAVPFRLRHWLPRAWLGVCTAMGSCNSTPRQALLAR
eukprot:13359315-Alexandrium_andersonii.AAC.1